ncbi:hypothetical protein MHH33_08565 [Paenisporosarcina sp. FSL H8-0542]|uniref:hypothetical protein n=1 Tax=Paenisporosarcina sp. FSL H8-0542 TaxID=2921401 RepID=UPI0031599A25
MKKLVSVIFILVFFVAAGGYYYTSVDNNYTVLKEFYDFPIPKDAKPESESSKGKGFTWGKSKGTEIPLSYGLVIIKSGWDQVEIDGHNVVYEKDGKLINLTLAPKYLGILEVEDLK